MPAALALLGAAAVFLGASGSELVIALSAALGLARSGLLFAGQPGRSGWVEVGVGLAAIALWEWLYAPQPLAFAFAVWGYFLIQSGYFLLASAQPRGAASEPVDPFEAAFGRAERVLASDS